MSDIKKHFHESMMQIYLDAKKECCYVATRFLQLINDRGGVETAKSLIHKSGISNGFTKLWELNRLDLSVEALVLKKEFTCLFTEEERRICKKRLKEYGYKDF